VDLIESQRALRIEVRDWGVGFDPGQVPPEHVGLEGIRHRTMLLGGTATIHSAPGEGTQIAVEIPLPEAASTPLSPPLPAGG
jgi:signal transduction histidine kinase